MRREKHSNQIDMLQGSLWDKIMLFALPLAASSVLQLLFNSADIAVVGHFVGSEALAAVGGNTPVINMLINLFVGLSLGVNVVIANYIGQGRKSEVKGVVHTAVLMAVLSGFFLLILGMLVAEPILQLMNIPDDVLPLAALYLRIYFLGMPFIMVYNFGAAVLRSVGDTKRPMYCLIISGVINVILNLFLIVVCNMNVEGVAIATVAANAISAGLIVYFLMHEEEMICLDLHQLKIHKHYLVRILKIGLPAGIQSTVFSFSNVCIQTAVNSFGSAAIAGSSAAVNFEFFTYYVANAFAQATVTFTSQNYGAGQLERCKKIFRLSMLSGVAITAIMGIGFVLARNIVIQFYTADPEVIGYAVMRMAIVETFAFLIISYEAGGAALRGMGYSTLPAILTIIGSCGLRVVWIYTAFRMVHSFELLMCVYPITWIMTGTMVLTAYFLVRKREFKKFQRKVSP